MIVQFYLVAATKISQRIKKLYYCYENVIIKYKFVSI